MADPQIDATPQKFSFGGFELYGNMTAFTGSAKRRSVDHVYPKRGAADVEDMGAGQRRFSVRLVFTGPFCAPAYDAFKRFVANHPKGLLVHPIAGNWNAWTDGPDEDVDFSRALDEIQVRCEWREASIDPTVARDVPDPATAAQFATAQQVQMNVSIAGFLALTAKAESLTHAAFAAIDAANAQVSSVAAPVDFMRDTIGAAAGAGSTTIGVALMLAKKTDLLNADIGAFITAAQDLFFGDDVSGYLQSQTLLDTIEATVEDVEQLLQVASPSPAGAADAVSDTEQMLAACYVLDAAVQSSRPPTVTFVVPALMDVITVAMQTGDPVTALARASSILALNRIPNPAAISPGTQLVIPTR